jgi:hypothetical protein
MHTHLFPEPNTYKSLPFLAGSFQSVKEPDFLFQCRGDPWSPTEKRSFSGFPKENNGVFALRRWILPRQNPRASEARPYTCFFDMLQNEGCPGIPRFYA